MKKSEILKLESQNEDNDFKSLSLGKKSIREARLELFNEKYVSLLTDAKCIVTPFDGQKVVIDTQDNYFGIIDFYPKANRLLIRKYNSWKDNGLKYLDTVIQKVKH